MNARIVEPSGAVDAPVVSVVVLISERPEPLSALYDEFSAPLAAAGMSYEFLFVSGPHYGRLTAPLIDRARQGEPIRVLELGQVVPDAALLKLAVSRCRGRIVLTLPAYRRVEAAVLPELVRRVENGSDMAVARRWPRADSAINKVQSAFFHRLLRGLTQDRVHDIACGVTAVRRAVLQDLPLYGDFYRFLPVVALRDGYSVDEVEAPQHMGDRQPRVYAPGVYVRRALDVLLVYFLFRFTEKPLRFFGLIGSVLSAVGALLLGIILIEKLGGRGIADRPLLLLGALFVVTGVQAIALGLVGEIIVHLNAASRAPYRLREGAADALPAQSSSSLAEHSAAGTAVSL